MAHALRAVAEQECGSEFSTHMKSLGCTCNHNTVGAEAGGFLGLGCQPSARLSEQPCLCGKRQKVNYGGYWTSSSGFHMCKSTSHHIHTHTWCAYTQTYIHVHTHTCIHMYAHKIASASEHLEKLKPLAGGIVKGLDTMK